jgi:hypothetical protein
MLQMRELLRVAPNLPPPIREAWSKGDAAVVRAMSDVGLECPEIKELLDRDEACREYPLASARG